MVGTGGREDRIVRLPRILETTLAVGRTRVGSQVVNWTPEFMGFGNQLYLWCWAHERRHHRPSHKVLITAKMRPWLAFVPEFRRQFLVERDEVGLFDSRDHFWARKTTESGYLQGFSREGRSEFIRALHREPLPSEECSQPGSRRSAFPGLGAAMGGGVGPASMIPVQGCVREEVDPGPAHGRRVDGVRWPDGQVPR